MDNKWRAGGFTDGYRMASNSPTMAILTDRVPQNIAGKYYVDATCIDCDLCRSTAPEFYGRTEDGLSFISKQPVSAEDIAAVEEAMDACATSSIGCDGP